MSKSKVIGEDVVKSSVFWAQGHLLHGEPKPEQLVDLILRLSASGGAWQTASGWLSIRIFSEVLVVQGIDGVDRAVQTFRYREFNGELRRLTVCVTCGDVAKVSDDDLAVMAWMGCRKCGASVSEAQNGPVCRERHSFGSCLHCPEPPADAMPPFKPMGTRGEDAAATKAGPVATGDRSAGGVA